jgi:hypothetical protein
MASPNSLRANAGIASTFHIERKDSVREEKKGSEWRIIVVLTVPYRIQGGASFNDNKIARASFTNLVLWFQLGYITIPLPPPPLI